MERVRKTCDPVYQTVRGAVRCHLSSNAGSHGTTGEDVSEDVEIVAAMFEDCFVTTDSVCEVGWFACETNRHETWKRGATTASTNQRTELTKLEFNACTRK